MLAACCDVSRAKLVPPSDTHPLPRAILHLPPRVVIIYLHNISGARSRFPLSGAVVPSRPKRRSSRGSREKFGMNSRRDGRECGAAVAALPQLRTASRVWAYVAPRRASGSAGRTAGFTRFSGRGARNAKDAIIREYPGCGEHSGAGERPSTPLGCGVLVCAETMRTHVRTRCTPAACKPRKLHRACAAKYMQIYVYLSYIE